MTKITIHEIECDLPGTLRRVEEGESLLIVRESQPVAELKPVSSRIRNPRPYGLCSGQFTVPNDFDAPLPESMIAEFEGA